MCVIDDEHSIARYSRYTRHHVRVKELRDEAHTVDQLMEIGQRLGLKGWVLFPTREETVAAFSRHRDRLATFYRVPTPAWECVQWAWDKRNTYRLAKELDIPTPATWYIENREELLGLDLKFPVALKPAIKEHFVYATKAKAWRADNREQLLSLYDKAVAQVGSGEVMIQDLVPGDEAAISLHIAPSSGETHPLPKCMSAEDGSTHPSSVGPAPMSRRSTCRNWKHSPRGSYARSPSMVWWRLSSSSILAMDCSGCWMSMPERPGYHTIGRAAGVDFPHLLFAEPDGRADCPLLWCAGRPLGATRN